MFSSPTEKKIVQEVKVIPIVHLQERIKNLSDDGWRVISIVKDDTVVYAVCEKIYHI